MKFIFNMAMIGGEPTGLGVYAISCARITTMIKSVLITANERADFPASTISAPQSIGIGKGKLAAIKRQLWLRRLRLPQESLVYSPTHHGLPNHDNQIITLHDMICLRFPTQHFLQYLYFRFMVPRLLKRCRAVFTVSQTSRQDIVNRYNFPADRIYVVPNSVDLTRFRPSAKKSSSRYLLMVGARYRHKNVAEVLENCESWRDSYRLIVTSCAGKYRNELDVLIRRFGLDDKVEFRSYVSAAELLELYQGCSALVYPSLWEGFGIPPLEALACGRPVIASDIEIHREVLADAAIYVELGSPGSWQSALRSLDDPALIQAKNRAGMVRVRAFSPENSLACLEASLLAVEPALERL